MSARVPHLAILGAGPVGLEAALAAAERGWPFTVYEAADRPAASVAAWGHLRLFSPWDLDASPRARARLAAAGRPLPEGAECPTGAELVDRLLAPLAALPEIAPHLATGARVVEVSRDGLVKSDEIGTGKRAERPFRLLIEDAAGRERIERADVVLDCTGTWSSPNRLGDGGIPAPGERAAGAAGLIDRHSPDLADPAEAARWAGHTVLVAGAGHSAQTAVRDLAALAARRPGTRVIWALRSDAPCWGRVGDDPLPARACLAADAEALAGGSSPAVEARRGVVVESLDPAGDRLRVTLRRRTGTGAGPGAVETVEVDRVLSLTGYVGDHRLYRQLQVHECYATSGPMQLSAALLGAGAGDCLAQPSHGAEVLVNPEPGFFLLGSKSYGRHATFLMRAGWQQVDDVMGLIAAGGGANRMPAEPSPAAQTYVRSLFELLGDRDPLAVQRELVPSLRAAIAGLADSDLRRPERAGKWSIAEVIQHLADSEIVSGYRYRAAIAQDGIELAGYDQDAWAARLRYDQADVEAALAALTELRAANQRLLSRLGEEEWQRAGLHAERGRESVRQLARLVAGHDLVHRRQVERIKAAHGLVASPPTREHRCSVELPAPPERAFAALVTPSAIRSWWQAARAVVIAEPGGTWAAAWGAGEDDPDYATAATLEVFEPPRRLVLSDYRYRARAGRLPFEADFRVELDIRPGDAGGSVLEVVQSGFPAGPEADAHLAGCETGWRETLESLRSFLAAGPAPTAVE